ncbi:MAG: chaperone protein HscA [Bacteroidia bacterium]|nr:MAG: chaperone protein HscA [Bacteroidia bacterium]
MAKVSIDIVSGDLMPDKIHFGIDLGTTHSLIAYVKEGVPQCIADFGKEVIVPSVIHFDSSGSVQVGEEAKPFLITDPQNTIFSVKRLLGKSYKDIQKDLSHFSYKIIDNGENELVKIQIGNRFYSPIELSALILKELKQRAEHRLKVPVQDVVITVPAYFNDSQRQATKDAGKLAGLNVLRIISEPTAAAIAYGMGLSAQQEKQNIVVYDLGGGTFDVTILTLEDGVFDILSTNGDTYLGGDDVDKTIVHHWLNIHNIDSEYLIENKEFGQQIRLLAEQAKKHLTYHASFEGHLNLEQKTLPVQLTVEKLNELIADWVQKTIECCRWALKDSGLSKESIDKVILVGGSTRIPLVKQKVEEFFGQKPLDSIDPDQAVALGAALQADAFSGKSEIYLADITPLSLGIETVGGLMDVIIPRNSKIPIRVGRHYTTSVDGQVNLKIAVYQGERELVKENRKLGEFILKGIPAMPAGLPKIEVQFFIDADGILKVTAKELRSGVEQTIDIHPSFGLTEQEVEKRLLDSIEHAKQDIETRLLLEAKEEAKQMLYTTDKFLKNHQNLLTAEEITGTQKLMLQLAEVLKSEDRNVIQKAMEELNEFSKPFAQRVMDVAIHRALSGKNINEKF